MPARKLKEFLDSKGISYTSVSHPETYTAQRTAQASHVKGGDMAKTVVVKGGDQMCMVVLTANNRLDLRKVGEAAGVEAVELAGEGEFQELFPDCDVGAMPPFGNLYGVRVFVDRNLAEDEEIAFNAGTHTEVVKMAYNDFEALVKPQVGDYAL